MAGGLWASDVWGFKQRPGGVGFGLVVMQALACSPAWAGGAGVTGGDGFVPLDSGAADDGSSGTRGWTKGFLCIYLSVDGYGEWELSWFSLLKSSSME